MLSRMAVVIAVIYRAVSKLVIGVARQLSLCREITYCQPDNEK
jgi:hypothetical protein